MNDRQLKRLARDLRDFGLSTDVVIGDPQSALTISSGRTTLELWFDPERGYVGAETAIVPTPKGATTAKRDRAARPARPKPRRRAQSAKR